MTITAFPTDSQQSTVTFDGDTATLAGLAVTDPALGELLRSHPEEQWEDIVVRAIATGARGLLSMGLSVDVGELDDRFRRTLEGWAADAERCAGLLVEAGQEAMTRQLDPAVRSSLMARALADFTERRDEFLARLDPDRVDSHTARLIGNMQSMLGPGGLLEQRFRSMLDPGDAGSAFGGLSRTVESGLREIRDLLVEERGRRAESVRGTAKGIEYEDTVEDLLRLGCRSLGGIVERTSRSGGTLGPDVAVGDFVVQLAAGHRIVVEAKNTATLSLTGADGILQELDRAAANRDAAVAICVSAQPAFPDEVGPLGVYGSRILVVDEGDGLMLTAALRIAAQMAAAADEGGDTVDLVAVSERLSRLRRLARRFSTTKKSLSDVKSSVEGVRQGLDAMRTELLDLVDDIERALAAPGD